MAANCSGVKYGYLAGKYPGCLGHLYSPGGQRGPYEFLPYALDNGAYIAWAKGFEWSERAWKYLLYWAENAEYKPQWVLVPDVVANRDATLERWKQYAPTVREMGFRPAFAVQNGMTFADVPDGDCVLFLGGTTDWKEQAIEPWCARFPNRVHVGRVNSWPRLKRCYDAGAISIDGTGWFMKDHGQDQDLIRFCELQTNRRAA